MIKIFLNEIKKGQKNFGEDVQSIINFILLTFIYFIGVGITSIFAKILNKHFLELKISKDAKTYWQDYGRKSKRMEEYYKQF